MRKRISKFTRSEQLKEGLMKRLRWDARVSLADVTLASDGRKVTVIGEFDKNFRRDAVLEIVRDYPGVMELEDRTTVRSEFYRPDHLLAALLRNEVQNLNANPDQNVINVSVTDGKATFTGHVCEPRAKALASRIAWELSGIKDCNNQIRIVPQGELSVRAGLDVMRSAGERLRPQAAL